MAYISNYGGGAYNTITEADLDGRKTLGTIDLGGLRGAHGLAFRGGKLWFTAEGAKAVGSYDPATRKIDWIMGTGQNRTHMIWLTDDLKRIVTSNIASGTMTFIDAATVAGRGGVSRTDWNETVVPVGRGAEGFDVSPDGHELWAANAGDGTISVIDMSRKQVVATIAAGINGANRLKFTPDGKLLFVSILNGPEVMILNASSREVIKRIHTGHGAEGVLMNPDGSVAYVSCTPDNYVAVIDLKSLEIANKIDAGKQPDGLAWVAHTTGARATVTRQTAARQ
jgi:YVTN family beta-propeller protein